MLEVDPGLEADVGIEADPGLEVTDAEGADVGLAPGRTKPLSVPLNSSQ